MKIFFYTLLFVIIIFTVGYSQDTNFIKYLPLKVGNLWVYHYTGGYQVVGSIEGFAKYRIIGTQQINNKTFFIIQSSWYYIYGTFGCSNYALMYNGNIRIDSISGIVYNSLPCNSNPNTQLDSLKSQKNDTFYLCAYSYPDKAEVCTDTSNFTIFGITNPSKYFRQQLFEGARERRYVKNIGIVRYYDAQMNGNCTGILSGCFINGILYGDTTFPVGINQISSQIPEQFELSQNYPNPFNPVTKIRFSLPLTKGGQRSTTLRDGRLVEGLSVKLTIFDALGQQITTLVNEKLQPGTYEVEFDGTNYPSGVYFYSLTSDNFTATKKLVLIK